MSVSAADLEREQFDQWAETYEHSIMQWLFFDRVHTALLKRLPAGFSPSTILDIGCGTGRLLRKMLSKWPRAKLMGVDASDGMITRACRLTPGATFYQAYAEHLPLEDAAVDLVTTTISFHHWNDQVQGMGETWRVLRQGGYIALADTNIGHGHPLSRKQVCDLFESSGFFVYSQANFIPYIAITVGRKC